MCASTGLKHSGFAIGVDGLPFIPLDEREISAEIARWSEQSNGVMKITGKNARNLNPIIRAGEDVRELVFAWWWIWKNADGPVKFSAFNSRSDRLTRSWSEEFQHRAIIPASWYIEKGVKFQHPTGDTFGIAALTSTITEADGNELVTYSLVTRAAVGEAAAVHNRMPLILPPGEIDAWLDPVRKGDRELASAAGSWSEEISNVMMPVQQGNTLI